MTPVSTGALGLIISYVKSYRVVTSCLAASELVCHIQFTRWKEKGLPQLAILFRIGYSLLYSAAPGSVSTISPTPKRKP